MYSAHFSNYSFQTSSIEKISTYQVHCKIFDTLQFCSYGSTSFCSPHIPLRVCMLTLQRRSFLLIKCILFIYFFIVYYNSTKKCPPSSIYVYPYANAEVDYVSLRIRLTLAALFHLPPWRLLVAFTHLRARLPVWRVVKI